MAKRKSLGRGLDALLSSTSRPTAGSSTADLMELPLDLLQRGQFQPRIDIREETLTDLAESIRAQGVVQPIVVRPVASPAGTETRYEIVAGERRWRAAQLAGLMTVPALLKDIPDEAAVAVALIENIQREDLNPIEEARSLKRLVDDFQMTHAEAADAVGRSRAAVSNLLRLLDLPESVRTMLVRRDLDMGHARALLGITSGQLCLEVAQRVLREGWNVRETERMVRKLTAGAGKGTARRQRGFKTKDPNITRLETKLGETLGASVTIEPTAKGGRLVIRYHSLDELDGILSHIK